MNMNGLKYEEIDLTGELNVSDKWILTRLNETIDTVTKLADKYEFGEVGRALYNFIWDDFCDWYIEMAKLPLYGDNEAAKKTTRSILAYVLDQTMRLLHPFMPFITEEIWQNLPHQGESITTAAWPQVDDSLSDLAASEEMKLLVEIIRSVRNIRAEVNTPLSKKIKLHLKAKNEQILAVLKRNEAYITRFCNPEELKMGLDLVAPDKAMTAVVSGVELFLPLEGLINFEEELARLKKELEKWNKEVERVQKKLGNEGFMKKAPEKVIAEERAKEKDYLEKCSMVEARIKELQNQ
jgi:valyl-tRNA synthetase